LRTRAQTRKLKKLPSQKEAEARLTTQLSDSCPIKAVLKIKTRGFHQTRDHNGQDEYDAIHETARYLIGQLVGFKITTLPNRLDREAGLKITTTCRKHCFLTKNECAYLQIELPRNKI
jgi:hypothetical protein